MRKERDEEKKKGSLTVVLPVEVMYQSLNTRLIQMPNITRRLPRLLPTHNRMRINRPKRINHDLSAHTLNRIHHDGHGARVELFKRLLRVDVDVGEPASESGVGVVPADDHLGPAGLFEHVEHFSLEYVVDGFDGDGCAGLGHGEDVYAGDLASARCVSTDGRKLDDLSRTHGRVVDEFTKHQSHDLHRHTRPSMLQHLFPRKSAQTPTFHLKHNAP